MLERRQKDSTVRERMARRYTVDHAIQIITKYSHRYAKCIRQPLKVRENASFLIDVKWFENWDDLKTGHKWSL